MYITASSIISRNKKLKDYILCYTINFKHGDILQINHAF